MQARYSPVTYMYYRATSLTFDFIRDFAWRNVRPQLFYL